MSLVTHSTSVEGRGHNWVISEWDYYSYLSSSLKLSIKSKISIQLISMIMLHNQNALSGAQHYQ